MDRFNSNISVFFERTQEAKCRGSLFIFPLKNNFTK